MKSFISLVLFVAGALAQMTINTPANVVECQPTLLSWTGGTAPYYLYSSILPGASPTGAALESLGQQNSTSVTWICNIQSGTSLGLTLVDSTGLTAQSAPFTVNPGSSTTCTNTTSLVPGPTGQTTAAPGTTTAPGATSATTEHTSTAASGTSSKASSSTSASPSASSGAAYANVVRVGAAGVAGAAVAALLF